jgi:hypothetical protein
MWRNRERYLARVAAGLDEASEEAETLEVSLEEERLVLFSDLHRGTGDRADDFRPCRKIYHAALGYYDALSYRLGLLGDIEELWERLLLGILNHYEGTLALERRFFDAGRGLRLLGNHDEILAWPWHRSLLAEHTGGAPLLESVRLRFLDAGGTAVGEALLVHGHQGIGYSWLDRFVVKWIWAPMQRLTGINLGTPSNDHAIRKLHERALYDWASRRPGLLLVCGHTHQPVFMSSAWVESVRAELEALRESDADPEVLAMKEAKLHWIAADLDELRDSIPDDAKPCYFNTGCCSYPDGSITGIEIDRGRIRLVRWTGESGIPLREVLREAELASVFAAWRVGE